MNQKKKYNIGLDIGTESVGWAVTDMDTNQVLRIGKKKLWGVRLFEEGQSASLRRNFRSARRRYDRRKQRIFYLQEIFGQEIEKVDPSFFIRLQDGFLQKEDKRINQDIQDKGKQFKYNLFIDKKFNDSDYYKQYPTIYHLRYELMNQPTNDIRLVYLALHHIIKYRGNFLQEGKTIDVTNIDITSKLETIFNDIKENYDDISTYEYNLDYQKLKNILTDKKLKKKEKQKELLLELNQFIIDKNSAKNMANLMIGMKANLLDIFSCEADDQEQENKCKLSFEESNYEEKRIDLEEILDKNIELIEEFKELYDEVYLSNLFKDVKEPTISYLMKIKYEDHKKDKELLKSYLTDKDKKEFFSKKGFYQEYVKSPSKCPYEKLVKELKKILEYYPESDTKTKILEKLEENQLLPKITTTDNGVYPYQLNLNELNKIIETQSINFPFLSEKLDDGTYKIAKLLTFRIPYYVGPLNRNPNQKDSKAWIVKRSNDKITPYNFDKVVDKIECANQFITRMTSNCTYLYEEKAIPANSLLYSKFKVLNEIKQIKIDGKRIDKEFQEKIFYDLFLTIPKVTDKVFRNYLIINKYIGFQSNSKITGYSSENGFANNLKPYIDFGKIFGLDYVLEHTKMIENIIKWITIFEDKKILKEKIKIEYPDLDKNCLDRICTLKYKGWSALSEKLLTGIFYVDRNSKEQFNVMNLMETTNENFMQILFNKTYHFQDRIDEINFSKNQDDITIEDIQDLATSPANKRAIWQSIKIIKELVKIIGYQPEHIFIEMAKGSSKKERTTSRQRQLLRLYESCKTDIEDYNQLCNEIENNEKLDIDRYFLYYLQQGKCLYTGKRISLLELNECEIDHIIPRSLIKDDSLDNRALVLRKENQDKKDSKILLEKNRNPEIIAFWHQLKENKFISEKKYNNLMRTEFSEKDIEGFINKQLVETRQITKHVAGLLNNLYDPNKNVGSSNTVVQFINANISHNYREKYELYKYRQINNYHHAHDAYLAAVLGNYKTLLFKTNDDVKEFIDSYKNQLKENVDDSKFYGIVVDSIENDIKEKDTDKIIFHANEFKNTVCNMLYHQDILVTRKTEIYTGEFYNQTIYNKKEGKIPLKKGLDPKKYGGYNSVNSSYMMLIKYVDKGKEKQKLIGVPIMYTVGNAKKNNLDKYIKDTLKVDSYTVINNKILFNSKIYLNNHYYYISGYSIAHKDFEMINATELKLSKEIQYRYKYLLNFICNNKYPSYKKAPIELQENLKIRENNEKYWNGIFNLDIDLLFDELLKVINNNYSSYCKETLTKLLIVQKAEEFYKLELNSSNNISKKEVILQLFSLLSTKSTTANLSKLNKTVSFSNSEGRTRKSITKEFIIYNQSITGLKEDDYEF